MKATIVETLPAKPVENTAITEAVRANPVEQPQQSTQTAQTPQVVDVQSVTLASQYEANEIATQQYYDGKILRVTGLVTSITLDFMNNPILHLNGANEFGDVDMKFDKSDASRLASISKGQTVTASCEKTMQIMGSPMLSKCAI